MVKKILSCLLSLVIAFNFTLKKSDAWLNFTLNTALQICNAYYFHHKFQNQVKDLEAEYEPYEINRMYNQKLKQNLINWVGVSILISCISPAIKLISSNKADCEDEPEGKHNKVDNEQKN